MKFYVTFAQSGDFITEVESINAGIDFIKSLESEDRKNGNFEPDFYEIEDENHTTLYSEKYGIDKREEALQ